jgi:hypothetical protein
LSEEAEERKRVESRAWLGEPIEHGGGYDPPRPPGWVPEAGCCLLQAGGSIAGLAGLAALSLHLFAR